MDLAFLEQEVSYAYQLVTGIYPDRIEEMTCQDDAVCREVAEAVRERTGVHVIPTSTMTLAEYIQALYAQNSD